MPDSCVVVGSSGADDEVVEEVDGARCRLAKVPASVLHNDFMGDAPNDDIGTMVVRDLQVLEVLVDAKAKGFFVLFERDHASERWANLNVLLFEVFRDARVMNHRHGAVEPLGHCFGCLDRSSERRNVNNGRMTVLLDQASRRFERLALAIIAQLPVVMVLVVLAVVVAVPHIDQHSHNGRMATARKETP